MQNLRKKSNLPFHVLIKPAGPACNIRCEYCFYLEKEQLFAHEHSSGFMMKDEVLENLMEQIIISQPEGVKEIAIGWQGGEPTLCGLDFFRKAVEIQKKVAPAGVKIINGFQTNGILINKEWTEFFRENNFLIGLSIDGPSEYHDKYRKDRLGKGTFDLVMNSIELLLAEGVEFNTLTCIQHDNADHAAEIYNFLRNSGSRFHQYIPIVEPAATGKRLVSNRSVSPAQWGKFLTTVFKIWLKHDVGNVFVQQFDSFLNAYMGGQGGVCVNSSICGRSVVAERNGNIYSCDHFVNDDNLLGNIKDDSLVSMVDSAKQKEFGKDKYETLPAFCSRCRFLKLCYGECPKNRLSASAGSGGNLNYLCSGFKKFFGYAEPYFNAMAEAVSRGYPASEYAGFLRK